ncbi:MAG: ATP-binding protein [archaeon]|nr:ATP-binding protein [archaeon]
MRMIPFGGQDFRSVREGGHLYIDKSLLLKDIFATYDEGVYLFTRPRRFGKSMNLSMIDAFLNLDYKGNKWFDGLQISDHPELDVYRNRYPVLYVDMTLLNWDDYDGFIWSYNRLLSKLMERYPDLKDSDKINKRVRRTLNDIDSMELHGNDVKGALDDIACGLAAHYGSKVVVLIDEYDKPLNDAYGKEDFDRIRSFLRYVYTTLLEGNPHVQMAVLTGVMQIAKESIFSGLNNLDVNNVLSTSSAERFGFTEGEVRSICAEYGHPEKFDEVKEWYDGYSFGGVEIYNPWSVLKYIRESFVSGPYWASTSGNDIIADLLENRDVNVHDRLVALMKGDVVETTIDTSVSYDRLGSDSETLFSVMVMSGYLKARTIGETTMVAIPNKEMRKVFVNTVMQSVKMDKVHTSSFINALTDGDIEGVKFVLEKILYTLFSCRILDSEHVYQSFVLGLVASAGDRFDITGDHESGDGYHDIRMVSRNPMVPHILMELKKADDERSADILSAKALEQIRGKRYQYGLTGRVHLFGMAFHGKRVVVRFEGIDGPGQS